MGHGALVMGFGAEVSVEGQYCRSFRRLGQRRYIFFHLLNNGCKHKPNPPEIHADRPISIGPPTSFVPFGLSKTSDEIWAVEFVFSGSDGLGRSDRLNNQITWIVRSVSNSSRSFDQARAVGPIEPYLLELLASGPRRLDLLLHVARAPSPAQRTPWPLHPCHDHPTAPPPDCDATPVVSPLLPWFCNTQLLPSLRHHLGSA